MAFSWRGTATDIRYGRTSGYGSDGVRVHAGPGPVLVHARSRRSSSRASTRGRPTTTRSAAAPITRSAPTPTGTSASTSRATSAAPSTSRRVAPTQGQISADDPAFVLVVGDLDLRPADWPAGRRPALQRRHGLEPEARLHARVGQPRVGHPATTTCATTRAVSSSRTRQRRRALPPPGAAARTGAGSTPAACASSPIPSPTSSRRGRLAGVGRQRLRGRAVRSVDPLHRDLRPPARVLDRHSRRRARPGQALDGFGDQYSKYVLNFNGHSHDYERFQPIHGVTHITTGGGGAALETPWSSTDPRTVYRRCTCSTCAST